MDRSHFTQLYPRLYHVAADGSWPSIQARGLLSTAALVDLYDPPAAMRDAILCRVRKSSFRLQRMGLPDATVRDQLPLKFIDRCLLPNVTLQEFLDALNGRVFFFVDPGRLARLFGARAYRNHPQTVLTIDTADFLAAHPHVELAPYNTGSVHVPNMPARGPSTFVKLEQYPYASWRDRRGPADAIVELTVPHAASVAPSTIKVERWEQGGPAGTLWPPKGLST